MLGWMAMAALTVSLAHPLVIAHRGASGELPEHTIAAYSRAIEQGADFIEPDLVMTKDGVLVARHENEISGTTDVSDHAEFAERKTTKRIDGVTVSGWFTEDFTLAELKTLRARERLPLLRGKAHDGQFDISTFEEILTLAGKRVGVYPEIKHGSYFTSIGLDMEAPLLSILTAHGYTSASDPVFIQSFEVGNLQRLRKLTKLRLVQLIDDGGGPADQAETTYADMITPQGLVEIARYADAIGVAKGLIVPRGPLGGSRPPTTLIADAHSAGLKVHVWTFRAENYFLPAEMRAGINPAARGDLAGELKQFYALGVDGVFSDFPGAAVRAR